MFGDRNLLARLDLFRQFGQMRFGPIRTHNVAPRNLDIKSSVRLNED